MNERPPRSLAAAAAMVATAILLQWVASLAAPTYADKRLAALTQPQPVVLVVADARKR